MKIDLDLLQAKDILRILIIKPAEKKELVVKLKEAFKTYQAADIIINDEQKLLLLTACLNLLIYHWEQNDKTLEDMYVNRVKYYADHFLKEPLLTFDQQAKWWATIAHAYHAIQHFNDVISAYERAIECLHALQEKPQPSKVRKTIDNYRVCIADIQLKQSLICINKHDFLGGQQWLEAGVLVLNNALQEASSKQLPQFYYLQAQMYYLLGVCSEELGLINKAARLHLTAILCDISGMQLTPYTENLKKHSKHIHHCLKNLSRMLHDENNKENQRPLDLAVLHLYSLATGGSPNINELARQVHVVMKLLTPLSQAASSFWQPQIPAALPSSSSESQPVFNYKKSPTGM